MKDKKLDEDIEAIEKYRIDLGQDQAWVAEKLGITQPHYSKVVRGLVPVSSKLRYRSQELLKSILSSPEHGIQRLEGATIEALRTSLAFRELVQAALRMHKNA